MLFTRLYCKFIFFCENKNPSEINLPFITDLGKSCSIHEFLTSHTCLLTLLAKIKPSRKFLNSRHTNSVYNNTCVKRSLSKRPKIGFQDQLWLNAGQMYCRMLQVEHSAILSTFIKLPCFIKIFVLPFLSGRFTQVLLYRVLQNELPV